MLLSRPSMGFLLVGKKEIIPPWIFEDCRITSQFCMLLSRASMRFLLYGKKEVKKNVPCTRSAASSGQSQKK